MKMNFINDDIPANAQMIQTCVGTFYFGTDIPDFREFVHDVKSWDFNEGEDYDLATLLFQPTDGKMYKFLAHIVWDEMKHLAMFHLPHRFRFMLDDLDVCSEWAITERLLMLAGDIETNPGPVQSRPLQYRNNDPRTVKLEKALERKDKKIKKLIKDLRHAIKRNKIYPQGLFDTLRESNSTVRESAGELNTNLTRICNFLENSLPTIQANVQATLLTTTEGFTTIKDDLIKITLICIIIRLMMVWKNYKTALAIVLLFILKFYGFDNSIIKLVHELREKFVTPKG
jgi:hypothetical protein